MHQQPHFKEELNKTLKLGFIKLVTHATPWISSFVIIESNKDTSTKTMMKDPHHKSKILICLDPSNLDKTTTEEPYYYQTTEAVIPELHIAKYFTIVDRKFGFWQVILIQNATFSPHSMHHMEDSA